jgi:hypothetical protein
VYFYKVNKSWSLYNEKAKIRGKINSSSSSSSWSNTKINQHRMNDRLQQN